MEWVGPKEGLLFWFTKDLNLGELRWVGFIDFFFCLIFFEAWYTFLKVRFFFLKKFHSFNT